MKAEKQIVLLTCLLLLQKVVSDDDEDYFDEAFTEDADVNAEIEFNNKIYSGYKNWEERCLELGGEAVLKAWQKEQERLVLCFMEEFDFDEIQAEMEEKKKKGDLDEVFKKYCGSHIQRGRKCVEKFLEVSHQCLHPEDRSGLNITLQMVDAAINFTCHNAGDRIALFMAEEGMECVNKYKDDMLTCIKNSVPEVFQTSEKNTARMHFYVFQQENCRKGDAIIHCVEDSLMQCKDPTPSNLVHALLRSMKDETPCARAAQGWHSGSPLHTSPLLLTPLLLLLLQSLAPSSLQC